MLSTTSPKIAILMCTYNGVRYLSEQLDSIHNQGVTNIDLWVSDDGSSDHTLELLKSYKNTWLKGKFQTVSGPRQGYAENFLSLICNPQIQADYYAFSDQDDIWDIDKLTRAIKWLSSNAVGNPAMYCARTRLISDSGEDMNKCTPLFTREPSFSNAIIQSIAGGNTMVINNHARNLILRAGRQKIVSHDWWIYMLISGAEGKILYDPSPSVSYRQHQDNNIGANQGWYASISRLRMIISGRFREWSEVNIRALNNCRHILTPNSQQILDAFIAARQAKFDKRIFLFAKSGLYRQTRKGNIALVIAGIFNKL